MNNILRASPQLLRDLAQDGWELAYDPVVVGDGSTRYDLLASTPSGCLQLRTIREASEPQRYVLTGSHEPGRGRGRWHLSAQSPHPSALAAAIRANRPSIYPRSQLSRMLRNSGWRVESWNIEGQGVVTYTSPRHCLPLQASFITTAETTLPRWTILLPGGYHATASPDVPARVLTSFLLASAAEK